MNATMTAALLRGIGLAFIAAGGTFFSTLAATNDTTVLIAATGGAFFSGLAIRFGVEGTFDAIRAQRGQVMASDVKRKSS